jgi:hypothetical protein
MASNIPDSRLGRALMAGIPVLLAIFGAELLQGNWQIDRDHGAVALSWTAARDANPLQRPTSLKVTTCFGNGCGAWTMAVSLPEHHFGTGIATFARSMVDVVTGNCREEGKTSRPLAMA